MKNKTLILSIALNGYQWMYRKELNSHKRYAQKNGYVHQAITRPFVSRLGVECCWLKLTLMRTALISGYDNVLFLDADAKVKENCPALSDITNVDTNADKYVYMAKGYSGRFNSGVILAVNHEKTIAWLTKVIDSRGSTVNRLNDVGWGENGHVIELSKGLSFIKELNEKWNNTSNYDLDDYIQHSNCGPMRTSPLSHLFHKIIFSLSARYLTYIKNNKPDRDVEYAEKLLMKETNKILSLYPQLNYS